MAMKTKTNLFIYLITQGETYRAVSGTFRAFSDGPWAFIIRGYTAKI